ncbi:MAG: class I SAM-dependent methyltransferase [bacterium]|nr:class I SAM-dependent methyltransferase [bacterium]
MAWATQLAAWIPTEAVNIVDLGCGTGSLSILLAETGFHVTGIDLSPAMVTRARAKAVTAGVEVEFRIGNASDPDLGDGSFDVVLSRHLLWTLSDPIAALSRWAQLLTREGRLVLVEGRWFEAGSEPGASVGMPWDGGVTATELQSALSPLFHRIDHHPLTKQSALWGRKVADERFAMVARDPV